MKSILFLESNTGSAKRSNNKYPKRWKQFIYNDDKDFIYKGE